MRSPYTPTEGSPYSPQIEKACEQEPRPSAAKKKKTKLLCGIMIAKCVFELEICCSVAQLCPTLCDPMNCSPPGSSVHGILQARTLE